VAGVAPQGRCSDLFRVWPAGLVRRSR
jgi:hypothetical protein